MTEEEYDYYRLKIHKIKAPDYRFALGILKCCLYGDDQRRYWLLKGYNIEPVVKIDYSKVDK